MHRFARCKGKWGRELLRRSERGSESIDGDGGDERCETLSLSPQRSHGHWIGFESEKP